MLFPFKNWFSSINHKKQGTNLSLYQQYLVSTWDLYFIWFSRIGSVPVLRIGQYQIKETVDGSTLHSVLHSALRNEYNTPVWWAEEKYFLSLRDKREDKNTEKYGKDKSLLNEMKYWSAIMIWSSSINSTVNSLGFRTVWTELSWVPGIRKRLGHIGLIQFKCKTILLNN